jgi:peptide/nickel transport system permease protein
VRRRPLGVVAAVRRQGLLDVAAHVVGLVGLSVPNFWLATMLLLVTSLHLRWQPSGEWQSPLVHPMANAEQMLLPVLSLSAALVAVVMRMTRSAMLEVLGQDYVPSCRSWPATRSRTPRSRSSPSWASRPATCSAAPSSSS